MMQEDDLNLDDPVPMDEIEVITDINELGMTAKELAESVLNDAEYALRQLRKFQCVDRAIDGLERAVERLKGACE